MSSDNVFGFTDNARDAPPARKVGSAPAATRTASDDYTRVRINPDRVSAPPGDKPTKQVSGGSATGGNRGPMSGIEAAMSAQADQLHKTGKLASGEQSRG